MKVNTIIILAGVIAAVFICRPASAQIQDVKLAPLNPKFEEMINNNRRGLKGPVLRTPDGHRLGLLPSPMDLSHLVGREHDRASLRAVTNTSYDLRTLGRLTSVRDQGVYGTCWSFASYGSLESCLMPAETNDFSENNMVNLDGFDYGFDDGGFSIMATAYLVRWRGPVNEVNDPYPYPNGSPTGLSPVKHVQSVEIIGRRPSSLANDEIKQAVLDHGALCVGMYWSSVSYNSTYHSFYYSSSGSANHAVDIVGWDDNYSFTNFTSQPAGNGAFITRNSWGTNWGESGYFYVSYYDGVFARDLSEANFLFLNAESASLYSNIYQYDPLGWVTSLGYSSTPAAAWGANIFTVTNSGDLSAVSFYATSTNATYEIFVYTDISPDQPRSGCLRADQTGALTNAGYYTLTLPSPITLSAGRSFSVVVKFTTPSYSYPIPVEYALAGYSSQATASPGESFISSDGSTWTDTTDYSSTMNVCIKAFMSATAYPYSPPANVSATDGTYSDKVRLTWSHVSGAASYSIYRNTINSVLSASLLVNTAALYYEDSAVTPGIVYYYSVKTIGASGSSDYSIADYGSAQILPPAGLSASQGTSTDSAQLSWSASSGATGYIIYRNQTSNSNKASEIARSSSPSYDDTSVSPGTPFYYWVAAYSIAATSTFSSVASGYRGFSAPGGLSASAGTYSSGVLLTWNGVSDAVSYRIWRSPTANFASAVNIGETAATSYNDSGATPGTLYYYWVQAKRWSIVGSLSDYASGWRRSMAAGNNARSDFDGDGIMDFAVYQAATGLWYARLSGSGYATVSYQLGASGYRAVSCDYDGDGHVDPTVYQESTGLWTALLSSSGFTPISAVLGGIGFTPVVGDYDGDGRADVVVYQEATGAWYAFLSKHNYALVTTVYGGPGHQPVVADYDGDSLVDPAVYYEGQSMGYWYMVLSGSGYASYCKTTEGVGYVPVPADYDGDGKADLAVYNSASGTWSYWSSVSNYPLPVSFILGGPAYTAVPGDYDGDSKADIAVYHEATGQWYFLLSSQNYSSASGELGGPGYEPVGAVR